MKLSSLQHYRCPVTKSVLHLMDASSSADRIISGVLESAEGRRYRIDNGIPNLIHPAELSPIEAKTQADYERIASDIYDRAIDWQFKAFLEDEDKVREAMVDLLDLRPGMRVLEIGCGTGRDSIRLGRRLGSGELHLQDLSPAMVGICRKRLSGSQDQGLLKCALEFSVSNASWLPYPDGYFDAVFHFGGFNHFGDLKNAAAELTRVVRRGGRVVFGDEAVAPWLKGTEFDGIVSTNNPLFKEDTPLAALPASARDVTVRWVIANCFYLIAYTRGEEGPPPLDLDLPHSGVRGGSLRTRYFGLLEGVSPAVKDLVREAAARSGSSIHDWLDGQLRAAANKALEPKE